MNQNPSTNKLLFKTIPDGIGAASWWGVEFKSTVQSFTDPKLIKIVFPATLQSASSVHHFLQIFFFHQQYFFLFSFIVQINSPLITKNIAAQKAILFAFQTCCGIASLKSKGYIYSYNAQHNRIGD